MKLASAIQNAIQGYYVIYKKKKKKRATTQTSLDHVFNLMQRADSFEKTLMLGKIEGRRRRGRQRMRWLDGITNSIDMNLVNSGS